MAEAQHSAHAERHRALVDSLAAKLRPVRPLWPLRLRAGLWLLLEALPLAWAATRSGNDYVARFGHPFYALEVLSFAGAGAVAGILALRAAIPGRRVAPGEIAIAIGLALGGTVLCMLGAAVDAGASLAAFAGRGIPCAVETCMLGAAPWLALWWAVERAAPMRGAASGALVGAGAMLFAFALMRIRCSIDEPAHLLVWHLLPALALIALSALAGSVWLRFGPRAAAGDVTFAGSAGNRY